MERLLGKEILAVDFPSAFTLTVTMKSEAPIPKQAGVVVVTKKTQSGSKRYTR
jgi:hypothetical protein